MAVVQVDKLCKRFTRHKREPGVAAALRAWLRPRAEEFAAVRELSFAMVEGEALALIGPNGAGKSTVIKMLTGIMHPSSGQARVLGLVPWQQRTALALNVATVFGQRSQLFYHLPAGESLDLLACIYELAPADYRARRAMLVERFELELLLRTPVRKLSLGERMRCEIAASLLHRPRVLFLDEPTIGLDVIAKQRIRELVRELNRNEGVAVLLTSHDAGDIEQLCSRVLVINHGTLMLDDSVSALRRRYLGRKIIDLRLRETAADAPPPALPPGVEVLQASGLVRKLAVDTTRAAIESVVALCVGSLPIADLTIEDPPMEEIIAQLYRDQSAVRGSGARGPASPESGA